MLAIAAAVDARKQAMLRPCCSDTTRLSHLGGFVMGFLVHESGESCQAGGAASGQLLGA
jgi:hypothetical protein